VNLTIKSIPEEVYRGLKQSASENDRSLNAEIVHVLSGAAEEAERRRSMSATRRELERFVAAMPRVRSSVPLIRADRRKR
jgi:plasmid stability protein